MPKTVSISPEVADVLSRSTVSGPSVALPPEQLDRTLYAEVDKVLKALGGKWNRSARAHVFADGIPPDLTAALAAGKVVDQKRTLEQFFTPADLAARMARIAEITADDFCLEPSAGNGRLVSRMLMAGAEVLAIEFDPRHIPALNQLEAVGGRLHVLQTDFMAGNLEIFAPPTVVLMNPPFSRNQDIAHVERAFEMLAPGGRLVAVMSPHWTFAEDAPSRAFRARLGCTTMGPNDAMIAHVSVEQLAEKTFAESGTNVSAVLVTLRKAAA